MSNWAIELAEHWKTKADITNVFGLVLYTNAHANVKKVLADEDYWTALDDVSGPHWPVFSVRAQPGRLEYPRFPSGTIGLMVKVWREPHENAAILKAFGLSSTQELPALVLFCLDVDGEILSKKISLSDDSIDQAYLTLKTGIGLGAIAVRGLREENRKNDVGAYAAVSQVVQAYEGWQKVKGAFGLFALIRGLV